MSQTLTPRIKQGVRLAVGQLGRPQAPAVYRCTVSTQARKQSTSAKEPASSSTSVGNVETPGFKPKPKPAGPGSFRIGTIAPALIALALAATTYGVYEYYTSFSTWPPELQENLRAAIKARNRGDVRRAETNFREALTKARQCKPQLNQASSADGSGGGEAMLKISGIAIALASLLENEGEVTAAYNVLEDAWHELMLQGPYQEALRSESRTQRDNMRAVSIASKLGQLGQLPEVRVDVLSKLGDGPKRVSLTGTADSQDPAERYLVWSVEELFRIMLPEDVRRKALESAASPASDQASQESRQFDLGSAAQRSGSSEPSQEEQISIAELKLPPWVTKLDILASIESLGTFYSVHQVPEFAVPLYLQALSILLPKSGSPTVSERCKAALVMNNISQLMSVTNVKGASKWATKGLGYVEDTVAKAGFDTPSAAPRVGTVVQSSDERTQEVRQECLGVRLTLLYNLGVLSDMAGDKCQARTYFQKAYMLADQTGFKAAKTKAADSLAKLERRGPKALL